MKFQRGRGQILEGVQVRLPALLSQVSIQPLLSQRSLQTLKNSTQQSQQSYENRALRVLSNSLRVIIWRSLHACYLNNRNDRRNRKGLIPAILIVWKPWITEFPISI